MKTSDKNQLATVIGNLEILKQVYEDDVMPSMIDDADSEERVEEIDALIAYLRKTIN